MSFRPKLIPSTSGLKIPSTSGLKIPSTRDKIIAVLFAILPAFAVGSLVFGANVYYDLASLTIKTYEKTGAFEPVKIKGSLSDKGVQPIYEIEIEDGRTIRTTGNYSYFAPLAPSEVEGSQSKDLAEGSSTQKVSLSSKIINLPEIFSVVNLESKFFKAPDKLENVGGKTFKRMMPEYSEGGKILVLEKSPSCVKMIRDFFLAESANSKSLDPFSTNFTSCPHCMSSFAKRNFTFSSTKNFMKLFAQHFNSVFFSRAGGAGESGMDMPDSKSRIVLEDFLNCFASRQHIQNKPDHNSGSFESELSVAYGWIGDDVFIDNDNHKNDISDYGNNDYSKDDADLSNDLTRFAI